MNSLRTNVSWGLRWGLSVALVYSAYVLVLVLLRGNGVLTDQGISLSQVLTVYGITGIFGGLAVGLLRPLGRYLVGAAVIGYIVAALLFFCFGLIDAPLSEWQRDDVTEVLVLAAILGPAGGVIAWKQGRGS